MVVFNLLTLISLFLIGVCVGSFINLLTYRLPKRLSLIKPRSFCDNCRQPIKIKALIPIIGYYLTKRQCQYCLMRISFKYPFLELSTGVITIFTYLFYHELWSPPPQSLLEIIPFLTSLLILYTGLPLSIIDFNYRILPNKIVIFLAIAGSVLSFLNPLSDFWMNFISGLLSLFFFYTLTALYYKFKKIEGLGMGDVKLISALGFTLGLHGLVYTLLFASCLGLCYGVILAYKEKTAILKTAIPFGPFLCLAGFIASFVIF